MTLSYREIAEALDELPVAVRSARRSRGLSLRAAAGEIGCSFSTLGRFEARTDRNVGIQLEPVLQILRWLDATS
jgi:transcriptional regulator with XRE-family HTH domain